MFKHKIDIEFRKMFSEYPNEINLCKIISF